jgi:hypothetical protein
VNREELVARTRQLIDEGERLLAAPALGGLQLWLQLSDDLLRTAWGNMDRFHMAWLSVGRPRAVIRGRPLTAQEEAAYVREVVTAKNAVLLGSLDSAQRGLPFVGETGGVGPGGGSAAGAEAAGAGSTDRRSKPSLSAVSNELAEARRLAEAHRDLHPGPRAPRPEKMQR